MTVLAIRRLQKKTEQKKYVDLLMPISKMNKLLKESDYLAIACPLTPATYNMINKKSFQIMKKIMR